MGRHFAGRRQATLASLAAEIGVSRTTVSNAYNRPDQLSPELRRKVLETARRLGYPGPDPVARSLRTRKAGAIGVLLTESLSYAFRDPVALGVLEGLALACEEAGIGLQLVPAGPGSGDVAAVHRAGVDGFVVYSVPDDDPHLTAILQRPVPTVIIDQPLIDGIDRVGPDDAAAMRSLADHLIGLGHRDVGVVCLRLSQDRNDGPAPMPRQHHARYHTQRARLQAVAAAFAEVGVDWSSVPVVERYEHSRGDGASAAAELLDAHPQLTAVVCTSDVLALGALDECRRRSLDVPGDISVSGFDGIEEGHREGLTTVRQPMRRKGHIAGKLLLARRGDVQVVTLDTQLSAGTTAAAPRAG